LKIENLELMQGAKDALKNKWEKAIVTMLVCILIDIGISYIPYIGGIASLIITGPLFLGVAIFSLSISRNQEANLNQIWEGFNHFATAVEAYLISLLFIFLWTLLLIIPGIIASIGYSMTFYIIADERNIDAVEALKLSKKMMDGYKLQYFYLTLRFLGWFILCILTLGIGLIWLIPYIQITQAKFYEYVKGNYQNNSSIETCP